jgi:uncharacterized delta-60 repeat protein
MRSTGVMVLTMRRMTALLVAGLLLASCCAHASAHAGTRTPSQASAAKARLDPSFGHGGQSALSGDFRGGEAYGEVTKGDGILISGGRDLRLLSSFGRTQSSFGTSGTLVPRSVTGSYFTLSDFTLDRRGRLLVIGTSRTDKYEIGPSGGPEPLTPSSVRILRFLPGGRLDRSFGRDGAIETTFGLTPAHDEVGLPLQSAPSVRATSIAVDRQGRIVVTGGADIGLRPSCEHDVPYPFALAAGFVARLRPNGALDPKFGQNGIVGGRTLGEMPLRAQEVGDPVIGPTGAITYRATSVSECRADHGHPGIGQLTPEGKVREAFGRSGAVRGRFAAFADGRNGSVVAVERLPWSEGETLRARLIRIDADGSIDRSFGDHGETVVKLGSEYGTEPNSLAVDPTGRILLGGTLQSSEQNSSFLARLRADGQQEVNFGPNGMVITPHPNLVPFGPSDLFLDSRGRVITIQRYEASVTRTALIVSRYLLRN